MKVARLFPIFLKLEGRCVLVVGGSLIAEAKIAGLMDTGAQIKVETGRDACLARDRDVRRNETLRKWAHAELIELEEREFVAEDLERVFLVVVASDSPALNSSIYNDAQKRGVLCNVVDVNDECDFYYPAVVQRGDLQIAISTGGRSPSLAQRVRKQLEAQFGFGYAEWVRELGETRREVLNSELSAQRKHELLQSLASREAFQAAVHVERAKAKEKEAAENSAGGELAAKEVAV
jgi:precorrin-2 dehydrogenase / sirohydrochlorin ferrochelatase